MDSETPQPVNIEYEIELTPLALEMLAGVKDTASSEIFERCLATSRFASTHR